MLKQYTEMTEDDVSAFKINIFGRHNDTNQAYVRDSILFIKYISVLVLLWVSDDEIRSY